MAGNIDSLNFKVILNDEQFKTTVKKDISLAKELNTSLTTILNTKKKISTGAKSSFIDEQRMAREAAKTAEAKAKEALQWQKVRTEAEKTALAQQKVKASIEKSAGSFTGGGNSLTRVWLRFYATMWSVISAIRLFARTIGSAIKKISEFQQANANLATIMQVSRREIDTLTNDALMLGRTTEWTASQVTELQTALAKLGYNIPQIRNMQASVLQFATAVGATLPDAANLAGASLRMFGLHSSEMQKSLEILTASTNKTALDFEKLKIALPYVGAIAHSIGFDLADASSLLGVLANSGLAASRTGTGLRKVLLELSKDNGKLQTAMGGNIKTFDDFINGLRGLRDRGLEAGEAQKLVGDRAGSALLILANGVDDIKRLNDEVRDTAGLLKDIQSERLNTLHGSTLLLKSAWEGLIQTFRDSAGPMKDIVDWLTKIVRATSLAASRANRVAQGTKDVVGSDELTSKFKQRYDSLLGTGITPEEAAKIVQDEMQKWLNGAYKDLADSQRRGYKENGWNSFLYSNPLTHFLVSGKMDKGRAANEQVEAMENTMDAVGDYMANRAKEEAEIAANNYLEEWKLIFDTKGEKAARDAMKMVAGYENIKSQMEAYIENGGEEGSRDRGKGPTEKQIQNEAISDLNARAQYIRKLADAYEQLQPYLGKDTNTKMVEIFGDGDYSRENIEEQIKEIIAALRDLGGEGVDAANALEQAWGLDLFSKTLKQLKADKTGADEAQKSLQKYLDTIQDWADKNQELSGTGAAFDISRDLAKYNKALADADKKAKDSLKHLLYGTTDNTFRLAGYANINAQWMRSRANANASLKNDMTKRASDVLKEQLEGFDLTNWNDKTLSQILAIRNAIKSVKIPPEIKKDLEGNTEAAAALQDEFNRLKERTLENTVSPEMFKKIAKEAKRISGYLGTAATKMREFADATGDTKLAETAEVVGMLAQNMQAAAEGAESWGGWWGAVIGGLSDMFNQITEGLTEAAKASHELDQSVKEIRMDARLLAQTSLFSDDGIFGENGAKNVRGAVEAMRNLREHMQSLGDPEIERSMSFWDKVSLGWRTLFNPNHIAAEEFAGQGKLSDVMKKYGLNVYDEYGNFDANSIRRVIELFGDQDGVLEQLAKDTETYAEAMKVVEKVSESLVGGVVDELSDKIVDSWWEAGEAALDYSDTLGDVAKAYAKLIVQDMLLGAAFDEQRQDAFKKALQSGDTAKAMSIVEGAMQSAVDMLPTINEALQVLEPYRNMSSESSSSNSVGSGIKSITEDTASLLASYINAIRDDVSNIRRMQETGWESINLLGASVPTLNEHLAQIAATNFDIAQSNQSILSELQSVIGAPGTSGMVVRVEYA